ncbi:hypothetical protein M0R72_07160 [Candidatus Pacearchaeota archaeon]|jgi:hypothetical protein|nr:hypothetical protein [Candidatus Pacearchaeota archaeon]
MSDMQEILDRMRQDARDLSYYCFDSRDISECIYYFAKEGYSAEDINIKVKELLKGCRHSGDLWNWMYHNGVQA